jgi:chorismate synthase
MKNSFGNSLNITLFGESHGDYIGAVLDGIAPGIKIDDEYIKAKLSLRRPHGKISTARVEADEYEIVSGVKDDFTTGAPLCIPWQNAISASDSRRHSVWMISPRGSHEVGDTAKPNFSNNAAQNTAVFIASPTTWGAWNKPINSVRLCPSEAPTSRPSPGVVIR